MRALALGIDLPGRVSYSFVQQHEPLVPLLRLCVPLGISLGSLLGLRCKLRL